ncbi:MAG: FtsX-like permease family protein [Chitinophagales bacterium]
MKLAFQLAYRNLVGAGLRTWLNVLVLAFAFILIIFFNGWLDGWNLQAKTDTIAWEYGNGHLLHKDYDPYDAFTLQDGHGEFGADLSQNACPILIRQASIYPEGRMVAVLLKGIDLNQTILDLPTQSLKGSQANIPVMMGEGMAASIKLKVGDEVLLRWRDKNGTFDASNLTLVKIFDTDVPTVDRGQIWMPIDRLWEMTDLENHATMFVVNEKFKVPQNTTDWTFISQNELLYNLNQIMKTERVSSSILYILLLAIALLAIFDTQVLSVFRRQREIGTYIALGMTRSQVVGLFTIEGGMYSLFAVVAGSIIGFPIFVWLANAGIPMPVDSTKDMGISVSEIIYPVFGFQLIVGTFFLVVLSATIVSYLPAKKIANMNPVEALKGKLQ